MGRAIFRRTGLPLPPRRRPFLGTVTPPEIHNLVSIAVVGSGTVDVTSITRNLVHGAWGSGTSVLISSRDSSATPAPSAAVLLLPVAGRDGALQPLAPVAGSIAPIASRNASGSISAPSGASVTAPGSRDESAVMSPSGAGFVVDAVSRDESAVAPLSVAGSVVDVVSIVRGLIAQPFGAPGQTAAVSPAVSAVVPLAGGLVTTALTAHDLSSVAPASVSGQVTGLFAFCPAVVLACPASPNNAISISADRSGAVVSDVGGQGRPDILVDRPAIGSSVGAVGSVPVAGHDLDPDVRTLLAGQATSGSTVMIGFLTTADLAMSAGAPVGQDVRIEVPADLAASSAFLIVVGRDMIPVVMPGAFAGAWTSAETETVVTVTAPFAGSAQSEIARIMSGTLSAMSAGQTDISGEPVVPLAMISSAGFGLGLDGSHDEPQTSNASAGAGTIADSQQESTDGLSVSAPAGMIAVPVISHGSESHAEAPAAGTLHSAHTQALEAVLGTLSSAQAQVEVALTVGIPLLTYAGGSALAGILAQAVETITASATGTAGAVYTADTTAVLQAIADAAASAGAVIEHRAGAVTAATASGSPVTEISVIIPLQPTGSAGAGSSPLSGPEYGAVMVADVAVISTALLTQAGIPPGDQTSAATIAVHSVRIIDGQTATARPSSRIDVSAAGSTTVTAGTSRTGVSGS